MKSVVCRGGIELGIELVNVYVSLAADGTNKPGSLSNSGTKKD